MNADKNRLLTEFGNYFIQLANDIEDIKEKLHDLDKKAEWENNFK